MPKLKIATGLDVYCEEHGDGPPLLLVMGTGADHRFWSAQVEAYAAHYRTVVYDARGVGQTTVPSDPTSCTMALMADDAAALLDALGIGKAHVSGLSLGATVVQELCLRHPERVLTAQMHGSWAKSDAWFVRMIETLEHPVKHGDLAAFIRYALMWITSPKFLREQPETVAAMEQAFLESPPAPAGVLGHIHADKHHDALERLGRISCPVLVATGENDIQVPPRYGKEVADAVPGADWHLFKGEHASHLSCVEMADEFNRVTLEWLGRSSSGSGNSSG